MEKNDPVSPWHLGIATQQRCLGRLDENVDVQISPENMYWILVYIYRCEMNVIVENDDFRVLEI